MNQQTRAQDRREAVIRQQTLARMGRHSSSISGFYGGDLEIRVIVIEHLPEGLGPKASSFATHAVPWVEQVYALAAAGQHGDAIDLIYDSVEGMLVDDLDKVDVLFAALEPARLTAEEIVALLIVTLGAKTRLPNRVDFIARSRAILDQEEERADGVLHGLE
jgi:hypothetical protein